MVHESLLQISQALVEFENGHFLFKNDQFW